MNRSEKIPVAVVSGLLLLYISLVVTSFLPGIAVLIFSLSPLLLVWLVYNVIRFGKPAKELKEGDEWGYADQDKDDSGLF